MRIPEFTTDHNGVTYACEVMDAVEWRIGREDHGIFAALVDFYIDSHGQGLGWIALDKYDRTADRRVGSAQGMEWLIRVTERLGPPVGKLPKPVPCVVLRDQPYGLIRGFSLLGSAEPLLVSDVFPTGSE